MSIKAMSIKAMGSAGHGERPGGTKGGGVMTRRPTLRRSIEAFAGSDPLRLSVGRTVEALAAAAIGIADLAAHGALAGVTGQPQGKNSDGDLQNDLDVRADRLIRNALRPVAIAAFASEEAETPTIRDASAPISVAVDPLDGSSNLGANMVMGTIFSILPTPANVNAAFHQPGHAQLAAGFVVYGPRTALVLTLGEGVDIFTLDRTERVFKLTQAGLRIADDTPEYAINASNARHWEAPVRTYIDDCIAGREGPRGHDFNMRWIGALVAEAYRILVRGGIFLYPADAREGYGEGRLRLVYEAHPMAFLMEQAGGAASTGRARILDLAARDLHQRVPLIMGSRSKVERLERLFQSTAVAVERAPLFAHRGLFRV